MSCDFLALAAPGVQKLHPYQPGKPESELLGSFVFGVLLSAFCWRAKSCWPAVLLHITLNTSIQVLCFFW